MARFATWILSTTFFFLGLLAPGASEAQTTDGFHSDQVFPVVVDTASFSQRFTFQNSSSSVLTIQPRYFPGAGTAQLTPVTCPPFQVPAYVSAVVVSLRAMCPSLPAGSAFGFLRMRETHLQPVPFAAFSRVSNPAGNGFSVEAFPAHTFTSGAVSVNGVRRLAATGNSPSFQTNCFIGLLDDIAPPVTPTTHPVAYAVYASDGTYLGDGLVNLLAGGFTRILDVFNAVGQPTGDYNDATVRFTDQFSGDTQGVVAFCTVQDNTSFGADFRIGKQAVLYLGTNGTHDHHVARDTHNSADVYALADGMAKPFVLPAGNSRNVHVFYFRNPDTISCELYDPASPTLAQVALGYGLEMRLADGVNVLAGGTDTVSFYGLYLGDKFLRDNGSNTRYTIEVESTQFNYLTKPYGLHCQSGSGHTQGDMIRTNLPPGF